MGVSKMKYHVLLLFVLFIFAGTVNANRLMPVAFPGNPAAEPGIDGKADWYHPGSVSYPFRIAGRQVSNMEYCAFLNDRARNDDCKLYDSRMRILRTGSAGEYRYQVMQGFENAPVTYVTRVNAARYCNYLTNGRGDTENGAYVIRNIRLFDGKHYDVTSGPRDLTTPDAPVVYYLPSLDEWYKSAYFDLRSERYIDDRWGGNAGITLSNGREWLESRRNRECLLAGGNAAGHIFTGVREMWTDGNTGFRVAATWPLHFGKLLNQNKNIFMDRKEKAVLKYRNEKKTTVKIDCTLRDYYGQILWRRTFTTKPEITGTFRFDPPSRNGYYELLVQPRLPEFQNSRIAIPLAVTAFLQASGGAKRQLGLCAHIGKWEELYTHEPLQDTLEHLKMSGAKILRWDVLFGDVDAERIRQVNAAGFMPLPIISHWGKFGAYDYGVLEHNRKNTPKSISGKWQKEHIPPEFRMFAENVYCLVKKTGLSGLVWEMANEPTFWYIAAEDYAQFLRAGFIAAKKADPSCRVMMGDANTIFEKVLANNGGRYCDLIATHIYGYFTQEHWCLKGNFSLLAGARKRYGLDGRKFWLTETDICTYSAEHLVPAVSLEESRRYQALHVPRALAGGLAAGAEGITWYNYRDVPAYDREAEFGIVDSDGLPKPAFASFHTAAVLLGSADFVGKINGMPSGIEAFAFRDELGRDIAVLWRTDFFSTNYHKPVHDFIRPPQTVFLKAGDGTVELIDMTGERISVQPKEGKVEVPVRESAVFVRGSLKPDVIRQWLNPQGRSTAVRKQKGAVKILPPVNNRVNAKFMLPGIILNVVPGGDNKIRVRFYNHTGSVLAGKGRLVTHEDWVCPPAWKVIPEETAVEIPPGSMVLKEFILLVPAKWKKEEHYILRAEFEPVSGGPVLQDSAILRYPGVKR